jgi:uncharacterized protein YodC (DUF2158 family)
MADEALQIGDVVSLRHAPAKYMTVARQKHDGDVVCVWWNEGVIASEAFNPKTLSKQKQK